MGKTKTIRLSFLPAKRKTRPIPEIFALFPTWSLLAASDFVHVNCIDSASYAQKADYKPCFKIAKKRRFDRAKTVLQLGTDQLELTIQHTDTMAAIVAPVAFLAPRAVAPKARAARNLRATTFNGVKVAQPKVRQGRTFVASRKNNTLVARVIFFEGIGRSV